MGTLGKHWKVKDTSNIRGFKKNNIPWNKGIPHTENWKNKQRETMKRLGIKPPSNLGKHHTEETKLKIGLKNSIILKGRKPTKESRIKNSESNMGEKHWNWQGGITPINNKIRGSLEYKLWEDSVFTKDGYGCKKCTEKRISKLVGHHILNFSKYPELRFAIDNGITFCKEHHKKFHHIYGKKDNNQEQVNEFLLRI